MNEVSSHSVPGPHRHQSGQWRSVALAALVHILLLSFLWFGIRWQNKPATAVEAEVWDMTTREAAPKPMPVPVEEPPVPEPVKEKPAPVPVPVQPEIQKEDPEIALAQEKKRKLAEKKKEEEHQRQLAEEKRQAELKEKLAEQKRKEEKLAQEEADKKKLQEKEKLAKEQKAKEKLASEKLHKENMLRLAAQAGNPVNTGSGGNGSAAKSTGNNRGDASYIAKIAAKVRSNTVFSVVDGVAGNPTVEYRFELLPDGSLRGAIRKLKSSGNLAFDDAVAKGIEKSSPFPRDKTGQVPASLELVYRMKEE
ncbi:MAG: cell envelope integrity protein TolA [Burkholderiales bacterium]|nr:cell envelope integrity protein TolA [Burkholderiales bacterium]